MRTPLLRHVPLLALIALLGGGAALAAARASVTVKTSDDATLKTRILVNQGGRTLYHLTTERGKKVVCTGACASAWPPLTLRKGARPTAGPGVKKGKLGTIRRPDGRIQVTYAGKTLYRYAGDGKAGETNGQGIQKIWYVISPSGGLVKGAASSGDGTSGGDGGGYGGGYDDPGGGYGG